MMIKRARKAEWRGEVRYYPGRKERIGFDFYADIAVRIVQAREEKGMTQKQLSEALGWPAGRLANTETVKRRIQLDDLEDLEKALDVSINWLLEAYDDSPIGDCLYLVWTDCVPDLEFYMRAPNARVALLKLERDFKKNGIGLWSNARDRGYVRLVGTPVDKKNLRDRFGKPKDDFPIEKNPDE